MCFNRPSCLHCPVFLSVCCSSPCQFIVGTGLQECDWTYVENVVEGHLCADRALKQWGQKAGAKGAVERDASNPSGKVCYFSQQGYSRSLPRSFVPGTTAGRGHKTAEVTLFLSVKHHLHWVLPGALIAPVSSLQTRASSCTCA